MLGVHPRVHGRALVLPRRHVGPVLRLLAGHGAGRLGHVPLPPGHHGPRRPRERPGAAPAHRRGRPHAAGAGGGQPAELRGALLLLLPPGALRQLPRGPVQDGLHGRGAELLALLVRDAQRPGGHALGAGPLPDAERHHVVLPGRGRRLHRGPGQRHSLRDDAGVLQHAVGVGGAPLRRRAPHQLPQQPGQLRGHLRLRGRHHQPALHVPL
mmetsp:Transcript_3826/g.12201  ORF Transcript_3826/g.12201 Transcript_3826/m.12201 type:complete len:211 (-) Transcript_3826:300-932(-)